MLPGLGGLDIARELRRRAPGSGVVILSMFGTSAYVREAVDAGVRAYVLKDASGAELVHAVREAAAGRRYVSPALDTAVAETERRTPPLDPFDTLTGRERQVLRLAADGFTSAQVAARLGISPRTAEAHRANLMRKLGLHRRRRRDGARRRRRTRDRGGGHPRIGRHDGRRRARRARRGGRRPRRRRGPAARQGRVARRDHAGICLRDDFPHAQIDGIVSQLVVPITLDARVEGLIHVSHRDERPFSDADEEILVRLADHAALAVRNAASFAREQDARRAAEVSEMRYRQLVNEVPVCLFRTPPEGRFLAVNAAMARVFGYPDTETLLATPVAELYVERADRERWRALIDAEGTVRDFEVRGRRFDGSMIWIRHTAHALRDAAAGTVVAYEGAAEDITARRRAEDALVETEAQVRQLQKLDAVGRLAGGIAHDFNNRLTVICARSQLVLNRTSAEDERLRRTRCSASSAKRSTARADAGQRGAPRSVRARASSAALTATSASAWSTASIRTRGPSSPATNGPRNNPPSTPTR
ncbi:MAG: PAS domain S-box protein [Candidatus Rokubacteria bacterium]|nr:PAS domain S-box protein [Candidatus Rokubacteria bacterium]